MNLNATAEVVVDENVRPTSLGSIARPIDRSTDGPMVAVKLKVDGGVDVQVHVNVNVISYAASTGTWRGVPP